MGARATTASAGIAGIAAVGLAVAFTLAAPAARACEAGTCVVAVWPADGAIGVPLNARMWIHYTVAGPHEVGVRLLDGDGQIVPLSLEERDGGQLSLVSGRLVVATPIGPLEAAAAYTLELTPGENVCEEPAPLTFSTGTGLDEEPPGSAEPFEIEAEFVEGTPAVGPCDAGPDRHRYTVRGQPVAGAVAYELLDRGTVLGVGPEPEVVFEVLGSGGAPERCLALRAVDLAGNLAEDVDDDCEPVDDDPAREDCECRLGAGGSAGARPAAAWTCVALASAVGVRRWRRRSVSSSDRGS